MAYSTPMVALVLPTPAAWAARARAQVLAELVEPLALAELVVRAELAELEAPAARAVAAEDDLRRTARTSGSAGRTARGSRRSRRFVNACVFVDDVRDKLGEQSVDDAQATRHLARDVEDDERIRA